MAKSDIYVKGFRVIDEDEEKPKKHNKKKVPVQISFTANFSKKVANELVDANKTSSWYKSQDELSYGEFRLTPKRPFRVKVRKVS